MKSSITKKTSQKIILESGKDCKQCGHCCKYSTGYMLDEDVERIAKHLGMDKNAFIKKYCEKISLFNKELHKPKTLKKPFGHCVFLENNKCSIHKVKPLYCKIGTCKEKGEEITIWYKLNYLVDTDDPESIRQWKTYLDIGGKNIPGGKLEEIIPEKKKLKKILSYEVLK